jgi:transposase
VLRLKQQGLSKRQIARVCGLARSSVSEYLMRARAAGLSWPLPAELDDAAIEARLFSAQRSRNSVAGSGSGSQPRPLPDWAQLHSELQRHKHVTLQLLWEEYKQAYPDGYQYSQFCELYRRWTRKLDLVMRQTHRAGEKLFVDYAGQTVPVVNPLTGEVQEASIFVAVLGASNYTYAEATLKADLESWIGSHVRVFELSLPKTLFGRKGMLAERRLLVLAPSDLFWVCP